MQQDCEQTHKELAGKLPRKLIVLAVITALALLIQIAGLEKPHVLPFPPSIDCEMALTQTSLDDGASLVVDSQGTRMLFANTQGKLTKILEPTASSSIIDTVLEISAQGDRYLVHGVKRINKGNYLSSESVLVFDEDGNYIETSFHQEFPEDAYVTMVEFLYGDFQLSGLSSTAQDIIHLDFSFPFFLKSLAFVLSGLWLLVLIVIIIIWLVRNKLQSKGKAALVALFCVLITVGYYTVNNCQQVYRSFEDNITTTLNQIGSILERDQHKQQLDTISTMGFDAYCTTPANQTYVEGLNQIISDFSKALGKEQSIYISVTVLQKDGTMRLLANSMSPSFIGEEVSFSENAEEIVSDTLSSYIYRFKNAGDDEIFGIRILSNNQGEDIAFVLVSSEVDNIVLTQITKSFDLFVNLLAILIGIFVVASAVLMCKKSFAKSRRSRKVDASERIANLSGVYMMVFKFAYSVDLVLVVYIAASMCEGMDSGAKAFFVAIPLAAYYAGQWLGTFLATPLMRGMGERRLALIASVVSAGIMLFTAWTVVTGSIALYSIGRGLLGFAVSGVLYVISGTLPLCAKTAETKKSALESSMYGSTAAAIITALIGGYVSQFAGYFFIYLIGAAICVLLFVMTIIIFGKKRFLSPSEKDEGGLEDESKRGKSSYRELWLVFLKPAFLAYLILFSLPNMLTTGYASYLFPLFSNGAGVSPVLLSNISVFALAAMYLCQRPIDRFARRFDAPVMLVVPSLVICIGLICFAISPNICWAIIMVFVVSIFNYMTRVSDRTYVIEAAEEYGQKPTLVQSNLYTVEATMQIAQSPILSAFVSLGTSAACVALGIVCGIMYSFMGIYSKMRRKRAGKKTPETSADATADVTADTTADVTADTTAD